MTPERAVELLRGLRDTCDAWCSTVYEQYGTHDTAQEEIVEAYDAAIRALEGARRGDG